LTRDIAFHYTQRVTGAQVKRIRQALGLTQQEFARQLGVHIVTVAKWETDAQGMRGPAARLIALLGAAGGKPAARNPQARPAKRRSRKAPQGAKRKKA
jgi:DNA-binding transcriptional regulator YiaG